MCLLSAYTIPVYLLRFRDYPFLSQVTMFVCGEFRKFLNTCGICLLGALKIITGLATGRVVRWQMYSRTRATVSPLILKRNEYGLIQCACIGKVCVSPLSCALIASCVAALLRCDFTDDVPPVGDHMHSVILDIECLSVS